jgi:hypothetical protein
VWRGGEEEEEKKASVALHSEIGRIVFRLIIISIVL